MFAQIPWKYPSFELKDLNRKIGQLLWIEPTDSDIQEGNFACQLWFRDGEYNMYLIIEDMKVPKDIK